jgi:hypothetical protein
MVASNLHTSECNSECGFSIRSASRIVEHISRGRSLTLESLPHMLETRYWANSAWEFLTQLELSVKYSKESTKTLCLLKTGNKVVEVE